MEKILDLRPFKKLAFWKKMNSNAVDVRVRVAKIYQEYFFENKLYGKDTNLILKQLEKQLNVKEKYEENVVLFAYLYHFDKEKLNDVKFNHLFAFMEDYLVTDYYKTLKEAIEEGYEIKF